MKKNKAFKPMFKPLVVTRKINTTAPVKKEYLKDLIQKLDADLPDNKTDDDYESMPDNYDGDLDYESSSSSDQTPLENEEY